MTVKPRRQRRVARGSITQWAGIHRVKGIHLEEEHAEIRFPDDERAAEHADTTRPRSPRSCWPTRCRSGRSEAEVNAFIDKIINAMVATVKSGCRCRKTTCCPARSSAQQGRHCLQARMDDKYQGDRGIGTLSAFAIAASEETGAPPRDHGADGGSAGGCRRWSMGCSRSARSTGRRSVTACSRPRRSATSAHHATLSAARAAAGRDWRGVVDGRGPDRDGLRRRIPRRREWAESALEHHLGMTCTRSPVTCRCRASSAAPLGSQA